MFCSCSLKSIIGMIVQHWLSEGICKIITYYFMSFLLNKRIPFLNRASQVRTRTERNQKDEDTLTWKKDGYHVIVTSSFWFLSATVPTPCLEEVGFNMKLKLFEITQLPWKQLTSETSKNKQRKKNNQEK